MNTPSGKPLNHAPNDEGKQPAAEPPSPLKGDVDEYHRRLTSSSGREGGHNRLPRAVPLRPVTGLPPAEESACAERAARPGKTLISKYD